MTKLSAGAQAGTNQVFQKVLKTSFANNRVFNENLEKIDDH